MAENQTEWPAVDPAAVGGVPRRRRFRWAWLFMLIACIWLAVIVAAVWQYAGRPRSVTRRAVLGEQSLSDGTLLVLEQFTTGPEHKFVVPDPDHEPSMLPSLRKKPTPPGKVVQTRPEGAGLMIWLTCWRLESRQMLDLPWWKSSLLITPEGEAIEDDESSRYVWSPTVTSTQYMPRPWIPHIGTTADQLAGSSRFPMIRSQGGACPLRIFDTQGEQVAEFTVTLPDTSRTPQWSPAVVPTTSTQRDLAVTLEEVAISRNPSATVAGDSATRRRVRWNVTPKYSVKRDGLPSPAWRHEKLQVLDALGNIARPEDCGLGLDERAWKLEMTLSRNDLGAFDASEQWTTSLIALPAPGSSQLLSEQARLQEIGLEMVAIGEGAVGYGDYRTIASTRTWYEHGPRQIGEKSYGFSFETYSDSNGPLVEKLNIRGNLHHLVLKMTDQPSDHREFLQLRDDHGRDVLHSLVACPCTGRYFLFFDPPAGAAAVQLTVCVHTARTVEFLIAPPEEMTKVE